MNEIHRLLRSQLATVSSVSGTVDVERLIELVSAAYADNDADRQRSEQERALMVVDVEEANRRLKGSMSELEARNRRFKSALDNMSQGLCMYDADGRLVLSNSRACELSGLPDGSLKPGMTLKEVLRANPALLELADDAQRQRNAQYVAVAATRVRGVFQLDLPDGRALTVTHEPTADGGFVDIFTDLTEQRLAQTQIAHLALHDPLTDLPNRVLLHTRLEEAVHRAERGEPFALLYLDLDEFKSTNDTLGHPIGDALLKAVAERLVSEVRQIDTVARVGGDEFAIIQSSIDQPRDAIILATRLIGALTLPYEIRGHQVNIGASTGIAVSPDDGVDPDQLLKSADMALYRAKNDGRGCYRFFEPEMDARLQARRQLEVDLRKALTAKEFEVYYQPLVNARTHRISGFEALVRWNSPERGRVSPAEFLPLCEEIGLIVQIGEWVLRQACAEATKWPPSTTVAVNVSARQFRNASLVHAVEQVLKATGLDPSRLEIEVTESVMIENADDAVAILHRLKALGVRISMDDFGTGYSSLSYLRSFPFDKIKIDQSFVRDLGSKNDSTAIVRAVTGLCGSLGVTSTAEGVETEDQLALLNAEDCDEIQGYLFSKPQPAEGIAALFERLGAAAGADPPPMARSAKRRAPRIRTAG